MGNKTRKGKRVLRSKSWQAKDEGEEMAILVTTSKHASI